MEKIFLDDEIICYKTTYLSKNTNEFLIDKIYKLISEQPDVDRDGYVLLNYEIYFEDIINFGLEQCKELIIERNIKYNDIYKEHWINRVDKKNIKQLTTNETPIFHNHVSISKQNKLPIPDFTYVYYIQLQDNLKNNEAHLMIKNKKGNIYSFLPIQNDFIILDGDVPHSPVPALNSSKDRLVLVGNIAFRNFKKDKTFI